ncbi:hypothetical protein ACFLVM_00795 [Chloroflexota bacterium]
MEKTSQPTGVGILNIIAGALGILGAISMFIAFSIVSGGCGIPGMGAIPVFVPGIVLGTAIPLLLIGILALVGGIFAIQRKRWGWVLAGSIASIFIVFLLGVPAVILTGISKNEFD